MAELVWNGKYEGGVRVEPSRVAFPLRTEEVHGGAAADPNRLVLGDVAATLRSLCERYAGSVALVYVDPPFDTGGEFDFLASIPGAPDDAPRISIPAYKDARGLDRWLAWFFETAVNLRELLADGGSLYVHLDAHVAHYAKVALDEVFGVSAFQREIIWRIGWVSGFKSRARGWIRNHDTLLYYAKGGRPATFHKEYIPYAPGYTRRDGALPRGAGHPIEDVWNASDADRLDSIQIMSFSGEKVGYPTQKNEALVGRIVRASSRPGDLVLDCFVGSGTTAAVAEKLGRRWIAGDGSPIAVHVTRKRLLSDPRVGPFVVQSVVQNGGADIPWHVSAGKLTAHARVDGRRATIELTSFGLRRARVPASARAGVRHWSQWIEGWCVDWDHDGAALRAESSVWRPRGKGALELTAFHDYAEPGRHQALVKVFDVLGGATSVPLDIDVEPSI